MIYRHGLGRRVETKLPSNSQFSRNQIIRMEMELRLKKELLELYDIYLFPFLRRKPLMEKNQLSAMHRNQSK